MLFWLWHQVVIYTFHKTLLITLPSMNNSLRLLAQILDLISVFGYQFKNSRRVRVARSDERPPGIRTVAGSILTSGYILLW